MKLLFDQNLSHHLVERLAAEYPGSNHVRRLGMATAEDWEVWSYAAAHGFVIVSKDADFQQRALLTGGPPKVIWLRVGNCPLSKTVELLRSRQAEIRAFEQSAEAVFLALS